MSYYKFAPGMEPDTFIFPTDAGWLYSVSFINNSYLFSEHTLLHNDALSFEITFGRSPLDKKPLKKKDNHICLTITAIIARQFSMHRELAIYFFLCDMTDNRGRARSLLFNSWFESCELPYWELFNYELQDFTNDTITYHAGLFIHAGHRYYKLIPDAFTKFLEEDVSHGKLIRRR